MTGFNPDHLPWGVWSHADDADGRRHVAVRLDDDVLDVSGLRHELDSDSLDALMALGPTAWREVVGERRRGDRDWASSWGHPRPPACPWGLVT